MSACENVLRAPPSAERILVIRLGALGDVLRTLPAVAALRSLHPEARLVWLVEPAAAGAVALSPAVDDVLVLPRPALEAALRRGRLDRLGRILGPFLRSLRAGRFDLVVDFHGLLKSGLLARASGAPVRVGYAPPFAREGSALFSTHRASLGAERRSRFERNAGLVTFLGGSVDEAARAFLDVPSAARDRMARALEGGPAGVVLHPGTSAGTPYKRWDPARFGRLAKQLAERAGSPCLVTAGSDAGEAALARTVVARSDGAARLAPPTTGIADLAALVASAPLFVGADSGPLHLAALVGTPVVQILGPTDPVENAPWPGTPHRVVRVPVPCSPCRRGCAAASCMAAVTVEQVAGAAHALLDGRRSAAASPWYAA